MREYVNIQFEEMDEFLKEKGFIESQQSNTNERSYVKTFENVKNPLNILVYTGIVGNNSRNCNEDAIRTLIIDYNDNIVHKSKITHRIQNWKENLDSKINECEDIIKSFYTMRDIAQQKINFCKLRDMDKPYVNYDFSKLSQVGL